MNKMENVFKLLMVWITFTLSISLVGFCKSLPNFVIFLADDLGYGDVGCFGNDTIRTPNIDKLANNGVKFTHHLAAASVCTPSRAALLTGRYPIRSGMDAARRNKVFFFVAQSGGLPENETSFAKALKQKNYDTALIGKWHLGNDRFWKGDGLHHPLNHGFDYFYGLPLTSFKDLGEKNENVLDAYSPHFLSYTASVPVLGITLAAFLRRRKVLTFILLLIFVAFPILLILFISSLKTINGIILENHQVVEQPIKLKGLTQHFVVKAKQFLENQTRSENPFLLFLPFVHVHTPLFCSDEFKGKSKHGDYGDNVEELDWAIGEVMSALQKLKLMDNTFVYFSSDNGGHVEEHGASGHREGGHNGIFRGGKAIGGFEGGIRVPTVINWSGLKRKGEISSVTSQMDLLPTFLELAEVELPSDRIIDGKSLVPLLTRNDEGSLHKFLFHYCGVFIHSATYIQNKNEIWKVHWTTPKFLHGTTQCQYVCHCFGDHVVHYNPPLLYNIANDPGESKLIDMNSDAKYSGIVREVEKARDEHMSTVDRVPSQFSFSNAVWKPWLQPCCNFPFCRCIDEEKASS